jgi:hypothetical protein
MSDRVIVSSGGGLGTVGLGLGLGLVALAAVGGLGYVGYRWLKANKEKFDPTSTQNAVYHDAIGGVGRTLSGDKEWTLGGWIFDVTHPGTVAERDAGLVRNNVQGGI